MKIDWTKLKAAIAEDTRRLRELKAKGRSGGSLNAEKLQATRHHAIAANARHKIHLSGWFLCNPRLMNFTTDYAPCFMKDGMSLAEQETFIAKELPSFLKPEELSETPPEEPASLALAGEMGPH